MRHTNHKAAPEGSPAQAQKKAPERPPSYYNTPPDAPVVDRVKGGSLEDTEGAVRFLETDPYFFRSGYLKSRLIRALKRPMLTPEYAARLRRVVLAVVDRRYDRDFRAYCRLAHRVDAPDLREQLTRRLGYDDPHVQRRARWVLEALAQDQPKEKKP